MAEAERFELSRALRPLPVFKTGPFSRLGKLPTNHNFNITHLRRNSVKTLNNLTYLIIRLPIIVQDFYMPPSLIGLSQKNIETI